MLKLDSVLSCLCFIVSLVEVQSCLSVCSHISKSMWNFLYILTGHGSVLTTLMYLRFCEWRHVCQESSRQKWRQVGRILILSDSPGRAPRAKSDIYDCLSSSSLSSLSCLHRRWRDCWMLVLVVLLLWPVRSRKVMFSLMLGWWKWFEVWLCLLHCWLKQWAHVCRCCKSVHCSECVSVAAVSLCTAGSACLLLLWVCALQRVRVSGCCESVHCSECVSVAGVSLCTALSACQSLVWVCALQ